MLLNEVNNLCRDKSQHSWAASLEKRQVAHCLSSWSCRIIGNAFSRAYLCKQGKMGLMQFQGWDKKITALGCQPMPKKSQVGCSWGFRGLILRTRSGNSWGMLHWAPEALGVPFKGIWGAPGSPCPLTINLPSEIQERVANIKEFNRT